MDPKTDSGMIPDDEVEFDSNVQSLLPEEVIWIMDQLLAREVHSSNEMGLIYCRSRGIREILWRRRCLLALISRTHC
jgi:hypothetical protein